MGITNWTGIAPRDSLRRSIDDFFNDSYRQLVDWNFRNDRKMTLPPVNVSEENVHYEIQVVAPGMDKEDFEINISNNVLTISAEKKEKTNQKKENYTTREYYFHSIHRTFNLPESVDQDNIQAKYRHGVLELLLPKKAQEETPALTREISVS